MGGGSATNIGPVSSGSGGSGGPSGGGGSSNLGVGNAFQGSRVQIG